MSDCVTPKVADHQAPLSLGFSRQEHWSGLPFPSPIHLLKWPKSKTLTPPNAGEDVEQQEFSFIGYRHAKQYRYFGKQFSDIKPTIFLPRSSNHTPWHLPREVKNVCPHKTLHRDVYISFICNFLNLEVIKCPLVDEWKINNCTTRQLNIIQCSKD